MKHPRNGPCHCGSGLKYKKCHLLVERAEEEAKELAREQARQARAAARKFESPRRISSVAGLALFMAAAWTPPNRRWGK